MPARPRDSAPGVHHIWTNATGNWAYFIDDHDRLTWTALLKRVADTYGWTVLAFCQMTTHVHLIVEVPDTSLPRGMQFLNREYSKRFNARHDRSGHFVRKRFGSRRITSGSDLAGAYAYVVLNPVTEGMCASAEDWRWSSYAATLGLTSEFGFVDARLVLAELGGAADALRSVVTARAPLIEAAAMSR